MPSYRPKIKVDKAGNMTELPLDAETLSGFSVDNFTKQLEINDIEPSKPYSISEVYNLLYNTFGIDNGIIKTSGSLNFYGWVSIKTVGGTNYMVTIFEFTNNGRVFSDVVDSSSKTFYSLIQNDMVQLSNGASESGDNLAKELTISDYTLGTYTIADLFTTLYDKFGETSADSWNTNKYVNNVLVKIMSGETAFFHGYISMEYRGDNGYVISIFEFTNNGRVTTLIGTSAETYFEDFLAANMVELANKINGLHNSNPWGGFGFIDYEGEPVIYNADNSNVLHLGTGPDEVIYNYAFPTNDCFIPGTDSQGAEGQILQSNGDGTFSWTNAPSGGASGDYLPLTGGIVTDNIVFPIGYGIETTQDTGNGFFNADDYPGIATDDGSIYVSRSGMNVGPNTGDWFYFPEEGGTLALTSDIPQYYMHTIFITNQSRTLVISYMVISTRATAYTASELYSAYTTKAFSASGIIEVDGTSMQITKVALSSATQIRVVYGLESDSIVKTIENFTDTPVPMV